MKRIVGFAVLLLSSFFSGTLNADTVSKDVESVKSISRAFSEIAKTTIPSVVYIRTEKHVPNTRHRHQDIYEFFGLIPRQDEKHQTRRGQGTGFIISADGYILTNHHIAGDTDVIMVRLHSGKEITAKLIGADEKTDIAIIKIDEDNLPAVKLGNSEDMEIGEWVLAIGNPFGLSETVTFGIISGKGRYIGLAEYEEFIQTDAAINPGNSGGPLINLSGEVIGINTAFFTQTGGEMGIGFAIPVDMAKTILEQLIETGTVNRSLLGIGIQQVTSDLARHFGLSEPKGILVSQIFPGSAAEKSGLKRGDLILELNGREVKEVQVFRNEIAVTKPGTEIKLLILRDQKQIEITAVVESMAPPASASDSHSKAIDKIGIKVTDLTPELERRLTLGYGNKTGVLILEVAPGSPAARVGIKPGTLILSVNNQETPTSKDFEKAMAEAADGSSVMLLVSDNTKSEYIALNLK
ncbi:MAG: Do family serine endopeptidase [Lentisphaerae bacterium]|nr:Do family serine endopeptidase [Lentisphaerota bacterium]